MLIPNNTFLVSFTKLNGQQRTMLCHVNSMTEKHAFVTDIELQEDRTIILSSVHSVVKAKPKAKEAFIGAKTPLICVDDVRRYVTPAPAQECVKTCLKRQERGNETNGVFHSKYSIKKEGNKFVVKHVDRVVGVVYSVGQAERLINVQLSYKF